MAIIGLPGDIITYYLSTYLRTLAAGQFVVATFSVSAA
jgi:hypothetical protein